MLANITFFLLAPVLLFGGVAYGARATFGRRPRGRPVWALVALIAGCGMYALAFAPFLVFLLDGAHPEFQGFYYSSLRFLTLGGWLGTLGAVLWECIRRGPSWAALGVSAWATVAFLSCLIATMFMVAVQV
jgi:hypothetical protein